MPHPPSYTMPISFFLQQQTMQNMDSVVAVSGSFYLSDSDFKHCSVIFHDFIIYLSSQKIILFFLRWFVPIFQTLIKHIIAYNFPISRFRNSFRLSKIYLIRIIAGRNRFVLLWINCSWEQIKNDEFRLVYEAHFIVSLSSHSSFTFNLIQFFNKPK